MARREGVKGEGHLFGSIGGEKKRGGTMPGLEGGGSDASSWGNDASAIRERVSLTSLFLSRKGGGKVAIANPSARLLKRGKKRERRRLLPEP